MAEIAPILPSSGEKNYRVTPQQRFEALLQNNKVLREEVAEVTISASRRVKGSASYNTLDSAPLIIIEELEYPGNTATHPFGKWAYVMKGNVFLVELASQNVIVTNGWLYRNFPKPDDSAALRNIRGEHWVNVWDMGDHVPVPLTCLEAGEDLTNLRIYLSPYQLSSKAMKMLQAGQAPNGRPMSEALVAPVWSQPKPAYVAVPDPLAWPLAAKANYAQPRLDTYQAFALNEQSQARHAIAGVLKAWIGTDNPLGVKNELRQQPDDYFAEFEATAAPLREKAEAAAAYMCECLSGAEHQVAEAALSDAESASDKNKSFILQHWCAAIERMQETASGAHFLNALVEAKERVPFRFILDEFSPLSMSFFEGHRWASLSAMGIIGELMPTYIARMTEVKIPELSIEQKALTAYRRLGIELNNSTKKRTYDWLIQNKPDKVPEKFQRKIKQWAVRYDTSHLPAQSAAEIAKETFDEAENDAGSWIKSFKYPVQAVLELTNLALAITSYKYDSAWVAVRSTTSLVGASVDLTAFVMEVSLMRDLTLGARSVIQRRIAVLAIVSAVLDGFEHAARVNDGLSQRDYGKSVGHAISVLGAGAVAVGGVMAMMAIGAEAGSVLGPYGAIIGAVGALVMAAGSLIASYLKLNAYEQYARHSFLGHQAGAGSAVAFPWSPYKLPVADPMQQMEVLVALLSNFRVIVRGSRGPISGPATDQPFGFVEIFPGNTDPTSVIEIEIIHTYVTGRDFLERVTATDTMRAVVRFPLDKEPIAIVDGATMIPSMGAVEIEREGDLTVKRFSLPIQPAFWRQGPGAPTQHYKDYPFKFSEVKAEYIIRILGAATANKRLISTPLDKRCKIETVSTPSVASIDDATFV